MVDLIRLLYLYTISTLWIIRELFYVVAVGCAHHLQFNVE